MPRPSPSVTALIASLFAGLACLTAIAAGWDVAAFILGVIAFGAFVLSTVIETAERRGRRG